jgi:hypothetical protein
MTAGTDQLASWYGSSVCARLACPAWLQIMDRRLHPGQRPFCLPAGRYYLRFSDSAT